MPTNPMPVTKYWVVRGRPANNRFDEWMMAGKEDRWHTKVPPKSWRPGDRLFFWASSPQLEIIGLGEFLKESEERLNDGETRYDVRYLTSPAPNPLSQAQLRGDPVTSTASFLKVGPAQSVLRLSTEEGERLYQLFLEANRDLEVWPDIPPISYPVDHSSDIDVDGPYLEGDAKVRVHFSRERNRKVVNAKRDAERKRTGRVACEACGFDFAIAYGRRGEGFCEVHHLIPLSSAEGTRDTQLADLSIVCSNCHRIIHRSQPFLTINELKELLRAATQSAESAATAIGESAS